MGYNWTNIAAAPVGHADGYVVSANMKTAAYTLAVAVPTFGARHVTCTRTVVGDIDKPAGIDLVLVGKDLAGSVITETLAVGAHSVLVTGTKFFASLTSARTVGWVVDVGTSTPDTIVVGWDAQCAVATGSGTLRGIVINTTAAGIISVFDANGSIAVIPASVADGTFYEYDVNFSGYLRVEPAAASDITILHSGSQPSTYSK
jgi:hypothetical protein